LAAGGYFFQPRRLDNLTRDELAEYARHCRSRLQDNGTAVAKLEERLGVLAKGARRDRWLNYAGMAAAVIGIATTPILTPLGLLAIAGAGISLAGVHGTLSRDIELRLVKEELQNRRNAIAFCRMEIERIKRQRNAP